MSQRNVQTYADEGFLTQVDLFSESEIGHFRACFDELETREGREKCQIGLQARHLDEEFIWQMSTDSRVIDVIQELMGEDIMLLSTHFFCKYPDPEAKKFVAWHQDVTYWGLDPAEAHTAWVAIDDSDTENGCMRVIPGSHKNGIVTHGESEGGENLLSVNQEIPDELVDTSQAFDLELKAGQLSIHDGQLYHASNPNTSDRRRCGLTLRYIAPHVKQIELNSLGTRYPTILIRGEDRHKNFPEQPIPFAMPA